MIIFFNNVFWLFDILGDGIFIDVINDVYIGFSVFVNGVVWVDFD